MGRRAGAGPKTTPSPGLAAHRRASDVVTAAEGPIEQAVLRAVAYSDVFDYPVTVAEAHRYLVGMAAPLPQVRAALEGLVPARLTRRDGLYMLRGRGELVATRRRRAAIAARLWPEALRYGGVLAELPFVRMVAVTGSLAGDNVESDSDIDYFVVTAGGRVWVSRGLSGVVRRLVGRRGVRLCPNYVLSEQALSLEDHNLVTAYELVQMVPLAGEDVYRRVRGLNAWTAEFLPNATGCPRRPRPLALRARRAARLAEVVLRTPIGGWMERAEWARFERMLPARTTDPSEVVYSADCFKDHVDAWGKQILAAYAGRIAAQGAEP